MKQLELKNKNVEELKMLLIESRNKLAQFFFELGENKLKNTSEIKKIKKDIARIMTFINTLKNV